MKRGEVLAELAHCRRAAQEIVRRIDELAQRIQEAPAPPALLKEEQSQEQVR